MFSRASWRTPGRPNKIVFSPLIIFFTDTSFGSFSNRKTFESGNLSPTFTFIILLYILSSVKEMNKIYYTLLFIFVVYLVITLFLYFFQRKLLYYPIVNNYSEDRLVVLIEKVKIKTKDNIELLSWYHKKNINDYKTILFLHGNAGTLEDRIHKINHFKDVNVNFLIIAWRGFSGNNGRSI